MKFAQTLISLMMILAVVTFFACGKEVQSEENLPKTPAYNFSLTTLQGEKITLSDFKGKALIVDIWDTWCPPCRKGIPDFIELYNEYSSKGLEIVGIAVGREGEETVRKFIEDYNINYINAIGNMDVFNGFGPIQGIPTTFVIDKNGNVYKKYTGLTQKEVFESDIIKLLELEQDEA